MLTGIHDKRQYTESRTSTGLRVLLVHEQDASTCAVSATVQAGHFLDPESCQGLAHLLEHSLFLGSENHPQANALNDFVSARGGSVNAWTGTESSNFYFDCQADALAESLSIFADMLALPLFDEERISKEIQAIEAEFRLKQNDDLRRLYQVHKETCNPEHPFHKFSVGNQAVFNRFSAQELRQLLHDFHQQYYTADRITLCVISNLPANQILPLVEAAFGALAPGPGHPLPSLPSLYREQDVGIQININPVKTARRVIITFPLPGPTSFYRSKPVSFISHLLGDEGPGSLLAYFNNRGWVTSLSAGGGIEGETFKDFNLNLQLTEQGMAQVPSILAAVFHYIKLIEAAIHDDWRYEEKARLLDLALNYSERGKVLDDAVEYSANMLRFAPQHIVAGDYLMDQPDAGVINHFLSFFRPANMRLKLIAPDIETNQIAQWYDTPYGVYPLPADMPELTEDEQKELCLPQANPYILENIQLHPVAEQYLTPVRLAQSPGANLWFAQDDKFNQPKGDCFFSFDCPVVSTGITAVTQKRLWIACMVDILRKEFYHAEVAGLNYHLYGHQGGFSLHTRGFSQKQLLLAESLVSKIHQHHDFTSHFEHIKQRQWQGLQNSLLNKPVNRLFTRLSVLIQKYSYSPVDMVSVLEQCQLEDVYQIQQQLLGSYHLEVFAHGNWQPEQVQSTYQALQPITGDRANAERLPRIIADIRQPEPWIHELASKQDDAAVVLYLQAPGKQIQDIACTIVVEQLLAPHFFNQIRTEQQLGYLVGSGYVPYNQHPGMSFYIQSPSADANQLTEAIYQFLRVALTSLDDYQQHWPHIQRSIAKQLAEHDANLSMKSRRLWMCLGNQDYQLEHQAQLIDAIQNLTLDDVKNYSERLLNRQGFGELLLYTRGKHSEPLKMDGSIISDPTSFKRTIRQSSD